MPEAIETLWKLSESELAQEIAEAEGKQQTASAILRDGLEIEKISKYTGLTPEEIKKLTS